jgi:hypothetical protein
MTNANTGIQAALSQDPNLVQSALAWLGNRPSCQWRLIALALLTLLSVVALFQNSIVVDGTRYFWLNDDQMISMRYARNLAEGYGLVWNPGERVEGYTNFLWTLVMAGFHLLPISDAKAAIPVKTVNWALACAVLLLCERLLRFFRPKPALALPILLVTMALCGDLIYWSVNGFETTLLTAIFLLIVVRILEESKAGRPKLGTYLLMSLLPLIRSDAYHVWMGLALLALGLHHDRPHIARLLGISLVLPVLHLLFRYWYYGDWLPNTYYLKVAGVQGRTVLGLQHLTRFVRNYGVALVLAIIGALFTRDRQRWLLIGGLAVSVCYVLVVGGDILPYSRFLAHFVPVIFVLALVSIVETRYRRAWAQYLLLLTILFLLFLQTGGYNVSVLRPNRDSAEERGTVAGVLIQHYTRPQASVAVFAAGGVPYFSRRYAIDLLGKSDPYIARQQARIADYIGHNKFDLEHSLGLEPDLVVFLEPYEFVVAFKELEAEKNWYYFAAIANHPIFRREYLPNPVNVPYLLEHTSVFIRRSSAELARKQVWREPEISR